MLEEKKTERGFDLMEFVDRYGSPCSLQKSSLAEEDCVWLGVDDPAPKQLAQRGGWVPYSLPEGVQVNTRMHLTQEHVRNLLPALFRFAYTGELTGQAEIIKLETPEMEAKVEIYQSIIMGVTNSELPAEVLYEALAMALAETAVSIGIEQEDVIREISEKYDEAAAEDDALTPAND